MADKGRGTDVSQGGTRTRETVYLGDGVEASEKLAVKYLKRAARHGEESAVEVLKDIRGD
ncbi:SEL1-like repeat protein [Methanomethylophilus alvi]|uniref:SEL1-like repeat protein n=1 Tax=Methanomethylophilus alvi TaxID=1291540 RepID=UPI0037DC3C70